MGTKRAYMACYTLKGLVRNMYKHAMLNVHNLLHFIGLAYQGKDIVFRFIIEYSSLRDFGP